MEIRFRAIKSISNHCTCTCCHNVGKVVKLSIPETKYFDGQKLSTMYNEIWFCADCIKKLNKVIKNYG